MLAKFLILIFSVVIFGAESKFVDLVLPSFLNFDFDEKASTRFRREAQQDSWELSKEKYTHILERFSDMYANVSIIGWQNILDSDGKIQEVESIELTFPIKESVTPSNNFEKFNFFDRRTQHKFSEVFDTKPVDDTLIDLYVEYQNTKERSFLYANPSTVYFNPDGLATYNETIEASKEEVDSFIKDIEMRKTDFDSKPVILKYDSKGELKSDSKITGPVPLVYVSDSWNASDRVLLDAPDIFTHIVVIKDKKDVPKELAKQFDVYFPEFEWRVLVNPGKIYIDKDVWIKMSTDGYEFFDEDTDDYLVYGILKSENQ